MTVTIQRIDTFGFKVYTDLFSSQLSQRTEALNGISGKSGYILYYYQVKLFVYGIIYHLLESRTLLYSGS